MSMVLKTAVVYAQRSFNTLLFGVLGKLPKLEFLVYEITDACNSRCQHCNIWKTKVSEDILTAREIERIFSSGFFKDIREMIITGGEPVLRHDITECLLTIGKHISPDSTVSLSTNGLKPDRVIAVTRDCLRNGMKLIVGVSLDGVGEQHDLVRGVRGNFEKVDYLLQELLRLKKEEGFENRLSVTVGYTFSTKTCDSMKDVMYYTQFLGLKFLPQVYEEFTYYSNIGMVENFNGAKLLKAVQELPPSFQKEMLLRAVTNNRFKFRCSSMKNFFLLRCNGDITPCLRYSHMRVGNLKDYSFDEIWESDKAKEARKVVNDCEGCSNTWATGWSMRYWLPPFLKILCRAVIKKEIARLRKPTNEKSCS